jgi:hypothetical protein
MADCEMNSGIRVLKLLSEDDPIIRGYDEEDYAQRFRYRDRAVEPSLAELRGARETTRRPHYDDWSRSGTHHG